MPDPTPPAHPAPHTGRVWLIGDSVDTNQLAGGGLAGKDRQDTLRINCLRGLRPDFTDHVRPGDILVAGENFGCGSARQSAVEALQLCGISYVLAESVARIHRRNSIALALPTMTVPGITGLVTDGDRIEIDESTLTVRNLTRGGHLPLPQTPDSVREIYRAGGMLPVIAHRLAAQGIHPPTTP
ncbi:LeuD/DmdB family oxidoreductase small subunit [Streptomyces tagetis]|uniref:3-isopropylmalate dehydratase small subunit n=1 Tax=Streptomyces tagetis TaxID=2820809 RepID=A0A940XIK9_9ACTN|nr:3-isopropylmalate dehydratase [Streptomyces sp. RG38]MBQ0827226.1 3-isopropylmalate dehydratase [Streptomyces sp. RG38]